MTTTEANAELLIERVEETHEIGKQGFQEEVTTSPEIFRLGERST
jgi:hypothetical protein